jgi:hypothetical protein
MSDDYITLAAIDALLALSQPELRAPSGAFRGVQLIAGMAMLLVDGPSYGLLPRSTVALVCYDIEDPVIIKEAA